jgi:hypothetical protein
MLKLCLTGVLLAAVCVVVLPSSSQGFGIGVIAGEPTGLSFKQWLSGATAVDGALAWSFNEPSAFNLHVDYLYHVVSAGSLRIPGWKFYIGIGGRFKLEEDDTRFGMRVPLGVTYLFKTSPFDFFLEIAPILDLAPGTEMRMNGGFGIRYYFGQPWTPDLLS